MNHCFDIVQGIPGYWSESGKFYPAIMGGSDAATSAAAMVSGDGGGNPGGSTDSSSNGDGGRSQESGSGDSFSSDVLNNLGDLSPADRKAVEKYLKQIDGQVTQRFQGIHDQYKWAKDLNPDDVQRAMSVAQMVENDPQHMFRVMANAFAEAGLDPYEFIDIDDGEEGEYDEDADYEEGEEYGDLPPAFVEKFEQQQQLLESIAEIVLDQNRSQQEAMEDQELEEELATLAEQFGEFDEDLVLSYAGMNETTLEEAVKYYKQLESKLTGGAKKDSPRRQGPTLNSGSAPSSNNDIDPTQLDPKQRKALVAQIIAAQGE